MKVVQQHCYICGEEKDFVSEDTVVLLRELICSGCKISLRSNSIAKMICSFYSSDVNVLAIDNMAGMHILNCCPYGSLHDNLSKIPYYTCSEFFPDIFSGERSEKGILCVDLQNIPFDDNTFDLIITEDVLEHVQEPGRAFSEIGRVLKSGGRHIFTVPVKEIGPTRSRDNMPPVYHPAPYTKKGSLVTYEYGLDICDIADVIYTKTEYEIVNNFHKPEDTTDLIRDYDEYYVNRAFEADNALKFYKYNVVCFISTKVNETSGRISMERYVPDGKHDYMSMEHKQRYQFVKSFAKGKTILDAACGDGYGSYMMSKSAGFVSGIDISAETIAIAKKKYIADNLSFHVSNVEKLDFEDDHFDIVVAFEAIEHFFSEEIQRAFLREARRVLKQDGVLIISTPNKKITDERKTENEYHIKEFYKHEFIEFLRNEFENVELYSQYYGDALFFHKDDNKTVPMVLDRTLNEALKEEYFIVVASQKKITEYLNPPVYVSERDFHFEIVNLYETYLNTKEEAEGLKNNVINLQSSLERSQDNNIRLQNDVVKLQHNIGFKDKEISHLHENIIALNERADKLHIALNEKTEELALEIAINHEEKLNLLDQIQEKAVEIKNKTGHIDQLILSERSLNREIADIRNSRSWKVASRISSMSRKLIPVHSKRRFFAKLTVRFVRHPFRFISKLTPRRVNSFLRVLKREGTIGVSRRIDMHMQSREIKPASLQLTEVKPESAKSINDYEKLIFKKSHNPVVTIIIPVYNAFEYTYNCLKSILSHSGDTIEYEVIIANDCSTDLTAEMHKIAENVTITTTPENLRFLKNCNHAAKSAQGKYIFLLNNDTQVQDNWLEPLVRLIESDGQIGAVGSKLLFDNGLLQEAGGIFWADGSAWNYGRLSDPAMPEYNYVKEVDYISGAALMVRKSIWDKLGGFDELFTPAYCEDADLCFSIRDLGYKVLYQPESVIVHFEGISHGTDLSEGIKRHQSINQKKFYSKWKNVLKKEHFPNGESVFLARDRSAGKKTLLLIDHYVPHIDDAGSRSIFQYLKMFTGLGFNIKFIGDNFYKHEPYTSILEQMGIEVLYGEHYANNWPSWLEANGTFIDYVYLYRPHISTKYIAKVKQYTKAKIIYNGVDLHFLREKRAYELTGDKTLLAESKKWQKIEMELMKEVDIAYYLSQVEVDEIKKADNTINAKAITAYIFEKPMTQKRNFNNTKDIMFVAGFVHQPNVDGVLWYAEEILPVIAKNRPDIKTYIIGSNAPESILKLASENLIVTGFVTDEQLAGYYRNCRLSIAPLRYGAGIKGKVVEAMYNRMPVVTTNIGAEGIHGADECLFVKDSSQDFADEILRIYDDISLLSAISDKQAEIISNYYSVDAAVKTIKDDFGL